MTSSKQIETIKNCMLPKCGKPIETFVRVDDKMFCSIDCAIKHGCLKQNFKPEDFKVFVK